MRLRLALVIAALSGFIALSYEIVWYRVISTMRRWRKMLETMTIDGKPVLDLSSEADQRLLYRLRGYNDMEPAWSIIDRYEKKHRIVTDDNMVTEWIDPLLYPKPED